MNVRLNSEGGVRQGSMSVLRAVLAALSARSFQALRFMSAKCHILEITRYVLIV